MLGGVLPKPSLLALFVWDPKVGFPDRVFPPFHDQVLHAWKTLAPKKNSLATPEDIVNSAFITDALENMLKMEIEEDRATRRKKSLSVMKRAKIERPTGSTPTQWREASQTLSGMASTCSCHGAG